MTAFSFYVDIFAFEYYNYKGNNQKEEIRLIRELSVKAKATNNKARILFALTMSASFALVLLSAIILIYKGILSMFGVVLFALSLVLYTKYIAPVYYYDVFISSDGEPLFVVRQQVGKKYSTLCRVALREIVKIDGEDSSQRRSHKTPYGMKKYFYLPTLFPQKSYRLTTMGRYEKAEIIIECSDEFAALISSYCKEAAENYIDSDEY